MHINDIYEQQAKDLLHRLCDAMGIAEEDRTRAMVEGAIAKMRAGLSDAKTATACQASEA